MERALVRLARRLSSVQATQQFVLSRHNEELYLKAAVCQCTGIERRARRLRLGRT